MTLLQQAEKLLITMTPAEKTQLLQWVVRDIGGAFPGIESTPGVCGGNPCIVRTRIPVWLLVQAKKLGTSALITSLVSNITRRGLSQRLGLLSLTSR